MRPTLIRTAAVLTVLMTASLVMAPSAGAFKETAKSGTTGFYTVPDYNGQPGVLGWYEDHPGKFRDELNKIVVKKMWTHGPFAKNSWVGQRIVIKKNGKPFADGKFNKPAWISPIIKMKANQSGVAIFPVRRWKTPESHKGRYRVSVIFYYYKKGTKNKVIGKARGLMEVYRHRQGKKAPWDLGEEGVAGWNIQRWRLEN